MQNDKKNMLLLGGIGESRHIAKQYKDDFNLIYSQKTIGIIKKNHHDYQQHHGGFAQFAPHDAQNPSLNGLMTYLKLNNIHVVVDMTHPFAHNIKTNSAKAASMLALPYLCYVRPPWCADRLGIYWQEFTNFTELPQKIAHGAHIYLAAGQYAITPFLNHPEYKIYFRAIHDPKKPEHDKPHIHSIDFDPQQKEMNLHSFFKQHSITDLVSKNSGAENGLQKIIAAHHLNINIWMQARPALNHIKHISTLDKIHQFITQLK